MLSLRIGTNVLFELVRSVYQWRSRGGSNFKLLKLVYSVQLVVSLYEQSPRVPIATPKAADLSARGPERDCNGWTPGIW